jgi:chromosome segregation ATPase
MIINHLDRIFSRHAAALRRFSSESDSITSDAVLLNLALALQELAEAMQQDNADADDQLARIERVLEAHDSALFADVASGRTGLATALDALISADHTVLAALTGDMMQANADLIRLREELEAEEAETDALRNQLTQMDADNAKLTQELAALRSWVTAHSTGSPAEEVQP